MRAGRGVEGNTATAFELGCAAAPACGVSIPYSEVWLFLRVGASASLVAEASAKMMWRFFAELVCAEVAGVMAAKLFCHVSGDGKDGVYWADCRVSEILVFEEHHV